MRFAFQPRRLARLLARRDGTTPTACRRRRCPSRCAIRACRVPRASGSALNLLFGLGSLSIAGDDQNVAWEAHVGGFIAGLLLFSLFDPVAPQQVGTQTNTANFARKLPCANRFADGCVVGFRTGTLTIVWPHLFRYRSHALEASR